MPDRNDVTPSQLDDCSAAAAGKRREAEWRHVKTGGLYTLIGRGRIEADFSAVIIYRAAKDGTIWVRPEAEFMDGRFVLQPAAAGEAPCAEAVDNQSPDAPSDAMRASIRAQVIEECAKVADYGVERAHRDWRNSEKADGAQEMAAEIASAIRSRLNHAAEETASHKEGGQ